VLAFDLREEGESLLDFIKQHPDSHLSLEALDFWLDHQEPGSLPASINLSEEAVLIESLGQIGHPKAVAWLLGLLDQEPQDLKVRETVVRALCLTREGVKALLDLEHQGRLPPALRLSASYAFNQLPWPALKQQALKQLPLLAIRGGESLPPLQALIRMQGEPQRGERVFKRPASGCLLCHRVGGEGVDFGPALTEIGTKLGPDALFQSILDPDAGIAFGYEGLEITMQDGETWSGILMGETETELSLKTQSGRFKRLDLSRIEERRAWKRSMMPSGLQQAMSVQDLVDLVTYLSQLQAAP